MTTPDLSDKYPHVDFLNLQFKNFGAKGFFSGKIETAFCPDDNSKVKQILSEDGNGKILVVDGQGSTNVALMGDMIADSAEKNNWNAIIINGCVRDVVWLLWKRFKDVLGTCPGYLRYVLRMPQ